MMKIYHEINQTDDDRVTFSSQTDQHPDIPYKITLPLPPMFNSQLFHHSKPIKFLSRSLPRLDRICWGPRIDDDIEEQIADAEAEMYKREIEEFYESERERIQANRELQNEIRVDVEE